MQRPNTRQTSQKTNKTSPKPNTRSMPEHKPLKSTTEMCAVCLNEIDSNFATLNCKHKFCSLECARGWWKFNESCPYCREEILFIQTNQGEKVEKDDISEESSEDDEDFKPRCMQCWADIDEQEEKKVCFSCSSSFIHKRCEMFPSRFWKCNSCLDNSDEKGREVFPIIPYNPIIHYLVIQSMVKYER